MRKDHRTKLMKRAEKLVGESLLTFLPRRLNELGTAQEVAKELKVSKATLSYWLLKFNIEFAGRFLTPGQELEVKDAVASERA